MYQPIKPQLFPNKAVEPEKMSFPLIASNKLDGCRMLFNRGHLQTRSGKPVVNVRIHEKYEWLKTLTKTLDICVDGEFYSHELTCREITSYFMSHDKELEDHLEFWCFDLIESFDEPYRSRQVKMVEFCERHNIRYPEAFMVKNAGDARECMRWALKDGYEGLILLSPDSTYKQGRITIPSGDGYKLKPYETFDSKIIGVVQATEVDPDAPKTINELGYSETSKKQADRIPVEKAAGFKVIWQEHEYKGEGVHEIVGQELVVTLAMTDQEKEEVWRNREEYIGRTVEWQGMKVGMKDVPRHPTYVRMRPDKDE